MSSTAPKGWGGPGVTPMSSSSAPSATWYPEDASPGPSQKWDPQFYQQHCAFVSDLASPLLDLLDPKPGERILDLGCGDGTLGVRLQAGGCSVLGVDSSPEMVTQATARGLDAEVVDGQELPKRFVSPEFDAVFSNASLHWMKRDPRAVVAGVRTCLKPGGRFVGEFGGFGNVAAVVTAISSALLRTNACTSTADVIGRHPWFFPTAPDYRKLLEQEGFAVESIELIPRPTELPGGIQSWLAAFAQPFFVGVTEEQRDTVCSEVEELLRPTLCTPSGVWFADYVRLRFRAVAPV